MPWRGNNVNYLVQMEAAMSPTCGRKRISIFRNITGFNITKFRTSSPSLFWKRIASHCTVPMIIPGTADVTSIPQLSAVFGLLAYKGEVTTLSLQSGTREVHKIISTANRFIFYSISHILFFSGDKPKQSGCFCSCTWDVDVQSCEPNRIKLRQSNRIHTSFKISRI